MSLKIWLPLDGNLENKGTMSNIATGSNITVESAGKIGSCYSFNGSSSYIKLDKSLFTNSIEEFSYACWVKPSSTSTGCLFSCRTQISSTGITLFINASGGIYFDIGNDRFEKTYTLSAGTWYHIAFTYKKGDKKRIYINGSLIASINTTSSATTVSTNNMFIGASQDSATTVNANWLNGMLNDVRIYDHCLSAAEVKEISKGLICHYKLSSISQNFIEPDIREWKDVVLGQYYAILKSYSMTDFINLTNASNGDKFTFSMDIKATSGTKRLKVRVQHYNSLSDRVSDYSGEIISLNQEGRLSVSFTLNTSYSRIDFMIHNYDSETVLADSTEQYKCMKLERGENATEWIPYRKSNIIVDSSGYGHHGIITGSWSMSPNTPHMSACLSVDSNSTQITPQKPIKTAEDKFTFSMWVNPFELKVSTFYMTLKLNENTRINFGHNGGGARQFCVFHSEYYQGPQNGEIPINEWHMYTCTYDGTTPKIYTDGEFTIEDSAHKSTTWTSGETQSFLMYSSYQSELSLVSDIRFYATTLSDEDIRALYQTEASVVKGDDIRTKEFAEKGSISIGNNAVVTNESICELPIAQKLKYDPTVYVEPDGSAWIRIFHHNNPASYLFASDNTFTTGVYIDANRWFNFDVCNDVSSWEIMVKGKYTITDNEWKIRWIQQNNPMTATFANVAAANIIKITTNGYGVTPSSYGGLYKRTYDSTKTYLCCNNGTESNWFGAVGCWNAYQGGIPGWFSGNTVTVTTTGYNDIYLRIDNLTQSDVSNVSFKKSNAILAKQFIEV